MENNTYRAGDESARMSDEPKHPVKATQTSLQVVEALKRLGGSGRVTEVAAHVDVGKSAVHNHLSTLESAGFVTQDGDEYRLGLKFLDYGGYLRNELAVYETAGPEIRHLADETGELANLLVEERGQGVYIYREKGKQAVNLDTYAGLRVPLHSTALGKAVLAHLPEERVDAIVDEYGLPAETEDTIADRDELEEELAAVRERGYATDDEERLKGLRCVAAPILVADGTVLGAISVSAPTSRMRGDRFTSEIPEKVMSAANVVELNVEHS